MKPKSKERWMVKNDEKIEQHWKATKSGQSSASSIQNWKTQRRHDWTVGARLGPQHGSVVLCQITKAGVLNDSALPEDSEAVDPM
jgi:hypothetical protein